MGTIKPYDDMYSWRGCCTTELADAKRYYQKWEVDKIIEGQIAPETFEHMIEEATSGKADTSYVDEIATQVSANTQAILDRYTKQETNALLEAYITKLEANSMFANYSKVENTTLILNNENITIV